MEEGYPRPITDFGLPQGGIDGAFSWPVDRKTYFFKEELHWCYDEATGHVEEGLPAHKTPWGQFPTSVDAVLSENDGKFVFVNLFLVSLSVCLTVPPLQFLLLFTIPVFVWICLKACPAAMKYISEPSVYPESF